MLNRILKIVGIIIFALLVFYLLVLAYGKINRKSAYNTIDSGLVQRGELGLGEVVELSGISNAPSVAMDYAVQSQKTQVAVPTVASTPNIERLVIKTADIAVVVKDVYNSAKAVADYADKNGGFVVSSNIYKNGLSPYGEVVIRIPVTKFDSGVQELKQLGDVKSERVNGDDVTEEYVDVDAQLKNFQAVEKQYLQILLKAQKIPDILEVQRELTIVRGNIERLQGRMKYLRQSADLSTVTVHLSADPANLPTLDEENKWKPLVIFKEAIRSLAGTAQGLVNFIIWIVVFIPVWIVVGLVVWFGYRTWKRLIKKNL